jgi:RsiW-degrading membrane proteinase PrsW (M82 family)
MTILFWLAILPSILLARRVLRYDKIEKEPFSLLAKLFALGMLSCLPAGIIEEIGGIPISHISPSAGVESALTFLILVPFAEEICKYWMLRTARNNPNFNYTFDGIVYGVMVGLGFATLENILYVLTEGTYTIAIMRGVLSVPLHCVCGVFMGYYYGMSNRYKALGQQREAQNNAVLALMIPMAIHGIYDFSLSVDDPYISIFGFVFTLVMYALAIHRVRLSSKNDVAFWGGYEG